jgi:hypothetical protein
MSALFAWLVKEADGSEGIIGVFIPDMGSGAVQLVTASEKVAAAFGSFARRHATVSGKPVRLVRFSEAETLERL